MKLFKALPAILLATLLLAACGQTGPLYLPESETSNATEEDARQDSAEEEGDEEVSKGSTD
jgi:predicted small lipoprotein YifL